MLLLYYIILNTIVVVIVFIFVLLLFFLLHCNFNSIYFHSFIHLFPFTSIYFRETADAVQTVRYCQWYCHHDSLAVIDYSSHCDSYYYMTYTATVNIALYCCSYYCCCQFIFVLSLSFLLHCNFTVI